jgi:hypothetical protein
MNAQQPDLTEAGRRMLRKFLELEANEGVFGKPKLSEFVRANGEKLKAMTLPAGDGAAKATAEKLERDGFGEANWNSWRRVRMFLINDAGRAAIAKSENH